ncbi:MAG: ATP-grasp domain-containing protein, partial [Burkholderiales bacterium]
MNAAENVFVSQSGEKELVAEGLNVLIPDGEQDAAFKVLTSLALVPKIRVHIISSGKRPRTRYSRFTASYYVRRGTSEQEWFDQIREVVRHRRIDVILPVHAEAIGFACRWREQLAAVAALPFLPETWAFDIAFDKGTLANFLHEHNLPSPKTVPAARALDRPEIGFPLLIKPRRLSGGRGIQVCPDRKSLEEFVLTHQSSLEDYIVQEFIEGKDLCATLFCKDGKVLAHTLRQWTRPSPRPFAPSFSVRLIHHPQLSDVVERLMAALSWSGIANVGTRYNERTGRPEILDFNPRFGGNL